MAVFDGTQGDDTLVGTTSDDQFRFTQPNTGNDDTLDGADGFDELVLRYVQGASINLETGYAYLPQTDHTLRLRNIESVIVQAQPADPGPGGTTFVRGTPRGDSLLAAFLQDGLLQGRTGDDTLTAEATVGTVQLEGGIGNDLFRVGTGPEAGHVRLAGGSGTDRAELIIDFGTPMILRLDDLSGMQVVQGVRVRDNAGGWIIDVHDDVEEIAMAVPGGGPNAMVLSYAELLASSTGHAIVSTDTGTQITATDGSDLIEARGGDDWILTSGGSDTVDGGDGDDMVSFADLTGPVSVYGDTAHVSGSGDTVTLIDVEGITGTSGADVFLGTDGNDLFRELGGRDSFFGDAGADTYDGGAGRDWLNYFTYSFADPGVSVSLLRGRGWSGEAAGDRMSGIEDISAGYGNDTLTGDHGANRLDGSYGDDVLMGNGGDDYLIGGWGTDVAVFGYARDAYEVTREGFRTVVDYIGPGPGDGTDILAHVEILRFADGDVIL